MRSSGYRRNVIVAAIVCLVVLLHRSRSHASDDVPAATIRVATFNGSLNRPERGELLRDLQTGDHPQIRDVARILRRVRPDIVLLNEFDFEPEHVAVNEFRERYLTDDSSWCSDPPLDYQFAFCRPVNTGAPSGQDLNHNGTPGEAADTIGYGRFPGQYGMVLLSRYPIAPQNARTFQTLLWKSMPDAVLPLNAENPPRMWYSDAELDVLRLSSKSHWDVPVKIGDRTLHILASHPTPPAFDGPEDRNGRRNHDEIRFWSDYLTPSRPDWIVDDAGTRGGLPVDRSFVIVGDLNADPNDGGSFRQAITAVLGHARVNSDMIPSSRGAVESAERQGKANRNHRGPAERDTADFSDDAIGNLRVDYVLPSRDLVVTDCGVFWPAEEEPDARLVDCSDHRLVWIDMTIAP